MFWKSSRFSALEEKVHELDFKLRRMCKHEQTSIHCEERRFVNHEYAYNGAYSIPMYVDEMFYYKKCLVCDTEIAITKKEYYTIQKELVESTLKECE